MKQDWTDQLIDAAPCPCIAARIYRGAAPQRTPPLVVHLHGGAFAGGSLDDGHCVARLLADAGAVVISVAYPTGQSFPAGLDAAFAVLRRVYAQRSSLAARGSRLFVAGEEAGGNLAAGLALMARDQQAPPLAGQILLSPMLDPGMATCSIRDAAAGPVGCKWADGWHAYLGRSGAAPHPYAAPAGALRLAGVAPALLLTAADDPMRDESLLYADRLRANGVAVQCLTLPAPSGWPDALAAPPTDAAWLPAVRTAFAGFLGMVPAPAAG